MKVKRFLGDNVQQTMQKVKLEFGEDAVILQTRPIRKRGWLGFFQKPFIEVVAAVDEDHLSEFDKQNESSTENYQNDLYGNKKEKWNDIEAKMDHMNKTMEEFMKEFRYRLNMGSSQYDEEYQAIFNKLAQAGVYSEFIHKAVEEIQHNVSIKKSGSRTEAKLLLKTYLGEPAPLDIQDGKKKIILFLGPTGIGKTTTLAKIAAKYSLQQGMKVGLITEDTYRIAAVEQLKTYAEIMGLPLRVIYSPEDIRGVLKEYEDKQLILIDTAGKSPRDSSNEENIHNLIKLSGANEVFLVISVTTDYVGCLNIIKGYEFLNQYNLLFTKLDETTAYGTILNLRLITGKPISYITMGQNVPDDIEVFNPEKVVDQMLGRDDDE